MTDYRTPAGKAPDDEVFTRPPFTSDSALVGEGATRWRIRFVRKTSDSDLVFAVTEYEAARRWWGALDLDQPMREVSTSIVRGFGALNWHDENGYTVRDDLVLHLRAAAKRHEWGER